MFREEVVKLGDHVDVTSENDRNTEMSFQSFL